MILVTAVTTHYIPLALIALKSARKHTSFSSIYIFVADAYQETLPSIRSALGKDYDWLNLFCPTDLILNKDVFLECFNYFNNGEIGSFAKYIAIYHVKKISRNEEICVFIDADTYFYGNLSSEFTDFNQAVYLTPHLLKLLNDDIEHEIMVHGWINAGFLVFNLSHPDTEIILEWLINRISRRGFLAPSLGMNGDQTWVSALPTLFFDKVKLSRNFGINVAYWNIIERPVVKIGNDLMAGDMPLIMFHFSGFNLDLIDRLSKHSKTIVTPGSPLSEICLSYKAELSSIKDLKQDFLNFPIISTSKKNQMTRISKCMDHFKIDLYKSMPKPRLATKLGFKIDGFVRFLLR